MKKFTLLLLAVLLCMCLFTACNNVFPSPGQDDQPKEYKVKFANLDDYVCDISSASSVGIKKGKVSNQTTNAKSTDNSFWSRLCGLFGGVTANAEENIYVNSFIMQSEEGKIENVVFKRIVTENADSTLQGERVIRPQKDGDYKYIEFDVEKDFTYTVSDDQGRVIVQDFTDNCGKDLNPTIGYAKVEVGNTGHAFIVHYSGIGREEVLTQEDMECEVEKCYTTENFTFICFVPKGYSNREYELRNSRPMGIGTEEPPYLDANGVHVFDRIKYRTFGEDIQYFINEKGELSCNEYEQLCYEGRFGKYFDYVPKQSYVIDNKSGCIYKLNRNDISINRINAGLVYDMSGIVYDIRVNEDNSLEFTPVTKNKQLGINNFFKDKYGNIFIQNDKLNALDEQNNVLYFTGNRYFIATDGTAIQIDFNENAGSLVFSAINKVGENFTLQKIEKEDSFYINSPVKIFDSDICRFHKINNDYLEYYYDSISVADFHRVDTNTLQQENRIFGIGGESISGKTYTYGRNVGVLLWTDLVASGESAMYYVPDVWAGEAYTTTFDEATQKITLSINDKLCIKFDAGMIRPNWSDAISELYQRVNSWKNISYNKVTIDGNDKYRLIIDKNGIPKAILESSYLADNIDSIVLQPINN